MSSLPAGKYEFPDMGIYIGEWLDTKPVGLGLMTREHGEGEFTGLWRNGRESCGVFLWPNSPFAAMYQGEWTRSKRDGFGVFYQENYKLMGEFRDNLLCCGVSSRQDNGIRFEGFFKGGLPVLGRETYADGGTYCGEYSNAKRHGFGKRTSITFAQMMNYHAEFYSVIHPDNEGEHSDSHNQQSFAGSVKNFRCGFVLSGEKSHLLLKHLQKGKRPPNNNSSSTTKEVSEDEEEEDELTEASTTETYIGQWQEDERHGYGICERSDGVLYEGQWKRNRRHGYGITRFADATFESGRYANGELIHLSGTESRLMFLYSSLIHKRIEQAIRRARRAQYRALSIVRECETKSSQIEEKVNRANAAALKAHEYSLETRALVKSLDPDYIQPGLAILEAAVSYLTETKRNNAAFNSALLSARQVISGENISREARSSFYELELLRQNSFRSSFRASLRNNRNNVAVSRIHSNVSNQLQLSDDIENSNDRKDKKNFHLLDVESDKNILNAVHLS